jgi:tetratricopeptide (TPR) repeat protein
MSSNTPKKILLLAANPQGTTPLRLNEEVREIDAGLQRSLHREQFILEQKWAVRPRDIQRAMLDINPQIVHFSGHGRGDEGLVFEDETGMAKLVDGEALGELFELFADQVECVVLNGCYSYVQAEAISQHIPYVIGMSQAIGDQAAIEFAVGFYDALGAGRPVEFAYKLGCNAIRIAGMAEYLTPALIKKTELTASRHSIVKEITSSSQVNLSPIYSQYPLKPSLGDRFFGREKDMEVMKREILSPSAMSLDFLHIRIVGLGGTGKTRLVTEFVHQSRREFPGGIFWLDASRQENWLVQLQTILLEIAPGKEKEFQSLQFKELTKKFWQNLREHQKGQRIFWILDNTPEDDPYSIEPLVPKDLSSIVVLETSRRWLVDPAFQQIGIEPLVDSEAAKLLQVHFKSKVPDDEVTDAVNWVGNLPLALEILNRSLVFGGLSWLELVQKSRSPDSHISRVLEDSMAQLQSNIAPSSLRGVTETFLVSYNLLDDNAKKLARVLAHLGPEAVPKGLYGEFELFNVQMNITVLVIRSFVAYEPRDGSVVMHRVLGDFLMTQGNPEEDEEIALQALLRLFALDTLQEHSKSTILTKAAPHAETLLSRRLNRKIDRKTIELRLGLGIFYQLTLNAVAAEHLAKTLKLLQKIEDVSETERQEYERQTLLPMALAYIAIASSASVKVEENLTKIQKILTTCEKKIGTDLRHSKSLVEIKRLQFGLVAQFWATYILRADFGRANKLANELVKMATLSSKRQEENQHEKQVVMHQALGTNAFWEGRNKNAIEELTKACDLYVYANKKWLARDALWMNFSGVACPAYLSIALWIAGRPDLAVKRCEEAYRSAEELNDNFQRAYAWIMRGWLHELRGELDKFESCIQKTFEVSKPGNFSLWIVAAKMQLGRARFTRAIKLGVNDNRQEIECGRDEVLEGVEEYKRMGMRLAQPYQLSRVAFASLQLEQEQQALAQIEEAISYCKDSDRGQRCMYAEFLRIRGEILWKKRQIQEAREQLLEALAWTQEREELSLELRCAISLFRLSKQQGDASTERTILSSVYEKFAEGFSTEDLREAERLLKQS